MSSVPDQTTTPAAPARGADVVSRRGVLRAGLSALGLVSLTPVLSACQLPFLGGGGEEIELPVDGPEEALQRLIEGNQRFASGSTKSINESIERRDKVVQRQRPFAMVFSCVDSRVPPELIFDRGIGDLFTIRTAGQVIDSAVMGSLEYGAYELEIPLLLVLGHTKCGAVKATMETVEAHGRAEGSIDYLVQALAPAVGGPTELALTDDIVTTSRGGDAGHGNEAGQSTDAGHGDSAADASHGTDASDGTDDSHAAESGHSSDAASGGSTDGHETVTTDASGATQIEVADAAAAEALAEELQSGDQDGEGSAAAKKPDALTDAITRNVELQIERIKKSAIIAGRVKKDRLMIVGGIYDLETGLVTLTANVPDQFKAPTAPAEGEEPTDEAS
jgi:carbonic anhydrase